MNIGELILKINKATHEVLKNFSKLNPSISITEVDVLKTISTSDNIIALFDLEEPFPEEFAIFDLSQFLSILGLFDLNETDIEFQGGFMIITDKNFKMKYIYSETNLIQCNVMESKVYKKFDKWKCEFNLSDNQLSKIQSASNILDNTTLLIKSSESGIKMVLKDDRDPLAHNFILNVDKEEIIIKEKCDINLNISLLNIIKGDYKVEYFEKLMKLTHTEIPLSYFIKAIIKRG